jgi:hypothetical protein
VSNGSDVSAVQRRGDEEPARAVGGVVERMIADVPVPRTQQGTPDAAAQRIARDAARRAALVSGSLCAARCPLASPCCPTST